MIVVIFIVIIHDDNHDNDDNDDDNDKEVLTRAGLASILCTDVADRAAPRRLALKIPMRARSSRGGRGVWLLARPSKRTAGIVGTKYAWLKGRTGKPEAESKRRSAKTAKRQNGNWPKRTTP